jgi:hypothetical protein
MAKTRKRSRSYNVDKLVNVVNEQFQEMLRNQAKPEEHIFFDDADWWKRTFGMWSNDITISQMKGIPEKYKYDPTSDISTIKGLDECRYKPKKILTDDFLESLYQTIQKPDFKDFDTVRKTLHDMTNYNLPSTVKSLKKWKHYTASNTINVMIIGAGPLGLFTALYLNELYNNPYNTLSRRVNILLVDNRIYREGVKSPYSRNTMFGFDLSELQPIYPHILCWNMSLGGTSTDDPKEVRGFDFIHVLENLLYIAAYHDKIPMFFTKQLEDFQEVKRFVKQENISIVFDCTGGRINTGLTHPLRWTDIVMKKGARQIKYDSVSHNYVYCVNGVPATNPILVFHIMDENFQEFLIGNQFSWPKDKGDLELIETYKNKCFTRDEFLRINAHFKDAGIRNNFHFILNNPYMKFIDKIPFSAVKYVKMSIFNTYAKHAAFAAAPLNTKCAYIRLGDTLVQTEFGIHRGLRTNMIFSKHLCQLVGIF